jgi:hypothetical protein
MDDNRFMITPKGLNVRRSTAEAPGRRWSIPGTPEEEALLVRNGFDVTGDVQGNVYYVLREFGDIIDLYDDSTWHSDYAAAGSSLEEHMARARPFRVDYANALAEAGIPHRPVA